MRPTETPKIIRRYKYKLHMPFDPEIQPKSGRIPSVCGQWFPIRAFTLEPSQVTCKHCLRIMEKRENEDASSGT